MKNSNYHTLSSSEIFVILVKKINITRLVICVIIILSILLRHLNKISFLCYIFILTSLCVLFNLVINFYILSLADILLKDCDSKKLLNTLIEYCNYSSSKPTKYIEFLYAAAFFYGGNYCETNKYLQHDFYCDKSKYITFYKLILASSYYFEKKDCVKHSEVIKIFDSKFKHCKYKNFIRKNFGNTTTILKAKELALARNFSEAHELFFKAYTNSNLELEKVMCSMYLAELDIKLGNINKAKIYLAYAIEHGNNLVVVSKARHLLYQLNNFSIK